MEYLWKGPDGLVDLRNFVVIIMAPLSCTGQGGSKGARGAGHGPWGWQFPLDWYGSGRSLVMTGDEKAPLGWIVKGEPPPRMHPIAIPNRHHQV